MRSSHPYLSHLFSKGNEISFFLNTAYITFGTVFHQNAVQHQTEQDSSRKQNTSSLERNGRIWGKE
jgi:hypothetical protein